MEKQLEYHNNKSMLEDRWRLAVIRTKFQLHPLAKSLNNQISVLSLTAILCTSPETLRKYYFIISL